MGEREIRKMEMTRKPFQGVLNIIRFNWHFYVIAVIVVTCALFFNSLLPQKLQFLVIAGVILSLFTLLLSLVASYYVYDHSDLYQLHWLRDCNEKRVLNIHAGFDETSDIIKQKFPSAELSICDFYDPKKHTEISIERARKAYPPASNTIQVSTNKLPFTDNYFDFVLVILSAHEIRDSQERIQFFKELNRITKSTGSIMVTEHLRDLNNFLAYSIGFLHFYSVSSWKDTFEQAKLIIHNELKTTPFLNTFILNKNSTTS